MGDWLQGYMFVGFRLVAILNVLDGLGCCSVYLGLFVLGCGELDVR